MKQPSKFADKKTVPERVAAAKATMVKVIDHFLYLLELHESNAIIVYSPTLSDQIPTSHAANAFNVFQRGLHHLEIIRLCALWDTPELEKECIPTVVELIDNAEVISALAEEMRSYWASSYTPMLNPSDAPELQRIEHQELQRCNEQFGDEEALCIHDELVTAIRAARDIMSSDKLKALRNLRDKNLAHSLSITRAENAGPVAPVKYGHERDILNETCGIVEKLYCRVNGTSFSIADSREIDRENAHALWDGCRFEALR